MSPDYARQQRELAEDWVEVLGTLRRIAAKNDLPLPVLLLHPKWRTHLLSSLPLVERQELESGARHLDVEVHFGSLAPGLVLR